MTSNLEPPPSMSPAGQAIWRDTLAQLLAAGTISRIDPNSLGAYVTAVTNHRRAAELLARSDILTIKGARLDDTGQPVPGTGTPTPNPALAIQAQAAQTIAAFARQFRLTAHNPAGQPPAAPTGNAEPMRKGRWCETHNRYCCTGQRSDGGDCCRPARKTSGKCPRHDTRTRATKLAEVLVREPTYGAPLKISAEEALMWELWRTAGHVRWLGERVAELESDALTWGQSQKVTKYWGEFPGQEIVERSGPHVLLDLYDRERTHLVKTATAIIGAGLADRLVRVAEEQGAAFGRVVELILADLGLSSAACEACGIADQQALVPVVVPRRFRAMITAGEQEDAG